MKQYAHPQAHYNRGANLPGKLTGREVLHGQLIAPLNPRVKALLAKSRQTTPTRYLIVQVDQELAQASAERQPIAKVEAAKRLFAKYHSTK